MCVAIIVSKGVASPSLAELEDAQYVNSDGIGMAWIDRGKVRYVKGISVKECYQNTLNTPKPFILHFRLATVGGKDVKMCHPFPIDNFATPKASGLTSQVLFHNGHFNDYRAMLMDLLISRRMKMPKGPISDTRVCALFAHKVGHDALSLIKQNRFATFSGNGEIATYGDWEKKFGRLYSNTNHFWDTKASDGGYTIFSQKERDAFSDYDKTSTAKLMVSRNQTSMSISEYNKAHPLNPPKEKLTGWKEMERVATLTKFNADRELTRQWAKDEQDSSKGVDHDPHSRVSFVDEINTNVACAAHHNFISGCDQCEYLNGIVSEINPEGPNKIIRRTN